MTHASTHHVYHGPLTYREIKEGERATSNGCSKSCDSRDVGGIAHLGLAGTAEIVPAVAAGAEEEAASGKQGEEDVGHARCRFIEPEENHYQGLLGVIGLAVEEVQGGLER